MCAPNRKRQLPRKIELTLDGIDVKTLAERATYVGSPEHKVAPSFAGVPRPPADATKCDPSLKLEQIQQWLRRAFELGCLGSPWEGDFPRYAWCKVGEIVYEARLVNRELGQYKGWQLNFDEWPDSIGDFNWDATARE